jgi:hypothetical protein
MQGYCVISFIIKLYAIKNYFKECGLTIVGAGCAPGLAMLRGKLRGRFRIEGSIIEDFVYSLW